MIFFAAASQSMVTPDELPERFQDIKVGTQTGARPKDIIRRQDGVNHSVVYPTDPTRNRSRKDNERSTSYALSPSTQRQRSTESQDNLRIGNSLTFQFRFVKIFFDEDGDGRPRR